MSYARNYEEKITTEVKDNYGESMGGVRRDVPMEPITEKLRCIAELGDVANGIARRAFVNMFGCSNEEDCSCEKERAPECMEEVLDRHRKEMKRLVKMLEEITCRLGI